MENTIVVFCADHGDMMGWRGRYGKHEPYDSSARTPVTIRFPGLVPKGVVLEGPVESIDLPCSLLAAVGVGDEPRVTLPASPGRSWWNYACGTAGPPREWAYSEMGAWKMVCDHEWKFVHRAQGDDELYNCVRDPHELDNQANVPELQARMQCMQRWMIESMSAAIAPPAQDLRSGILDQGGVIQ